MARVELTGLVKRFGDVTAVDAIDLTVNDREMVVLVGPSGCGKTTTLRMIAGLEDVTAGEIRIGERTVNNVRPKDRNIAMVFQSYALYPHMTVHDNMAFGLKMRKTPKAEIQRRVEEAARILALEDLLKRKPGELSGGQQQRVAVGRAIVRDPEVFLFDEPLSNLDAKLRVKMRSELVKLHRRLQATMVYVTHDQVEAMMMGDRIVVMHEGRIQQVGAPREVYHRPANRFVAEFIGAPPMNLVPGTMRTGDACIETPLGSAPLPPDLRSEGSARDGARVLLGVRPEHMVWIENGQPLEGHWIVEAETLVAQPLGAESYVEFASGGVEFTVRMANEPPRPAQSVQLAIDPARFHLFDAENEQRLTSA